MEVGKKRVFEGVGFRTMLFLIGEPKSSTLDHSTKLLLKGFYLFHVVSSEMVIT